MVSWLDVHHESHCRRDQKWKSTVILSQASSVAAGLYSIAKPFLCTSFISGKKRRDAKVTGVVTTAAGGRDSVTLTESTSEPEKLD